MKTRIIHSLWVMTFILSLSVIHAQNNVAINNTGAAPDSSAMLDVQSTSKGMLVPRMTTEQKELIASPEVGLLVFDTDTESFWFRDNSGWVELRDGNVKSLADDDDDTKIQVEEAADEDIIRFDISGQEKWVMKNCQLYPANSGNSIFIGFEAGVNDDLSSNSNIALGYRVLKTNTSGSFNCGIGYQTLFYNSTGQFNTSLGGNSLQHNTDGNFNIAVGYLPLFNNTSGHNNVAIGNRSLYYNIDRSQVVAIGDSALYYNGYNFIGEPYEYGSYNTALGSKALFQNDAGFKNTASGYHALMNNSVGHGNTAVGNNALLFNQNGNDNTAIGNGADVGEENLINATAIGANTIVSQSNSLVLGNDVNVGIGNGAPSELLSVGDDFGSSLSGNRITIGNSTGFSGLNIGEDIDNRAFILWDNGNNYLSMGTKSASITYGSTFIIKNARAGINNSAPLYDLHVGDGNISATNGSDTRMVVSDNDNEDRAAVLALAKTSAGAKVEAQLEANGSNTQGPSVIVGAASSHPLYIRTGNLTRMTVTSSGDVGIGTQSPTEKLHVSGNICYTGSIAGCSDIRYKKNLIPVSDVLPCLEAIGVYTYSWDTQNFPDKGFSNDRQLGVVAQELEQYFPALVRTDKDGYKAVDYAKLSALLLQGLNEQQMEIVNLKESLSKQQIEFSGQLSDLEQKFEALAHHVVAAQKSME